MGHLGEERLVGNVDETNGHREVVGDLQDMIIERMSEMKPDVT